MTEPQRALVDAAMEAMRQAGRGLREKGWPVGLSVDAVPERQSFAVNLRFELPPMPIPIDYKSQR